MQHNLWQGAKIRLRALEPSDWQAFRAFDTSDTEMARLGWRIPFPRSTEQAKKWAEETAQVEPKDDNFRFAIETLQGELVGTINVHGADRRNGTFEYGISLGRAHWRKGYATEAVTIVLAYYFGELCYQKCDALIYAFNEPSIQFHEKLGFQHEGRLRRFVFSQGQPHDAILMGITKEEFEARGR
jgi:RimJ/RimL family protein N-acetyltransferase